MTELTALTFSYYKAALTFSYYKLLLLMHIFPPSSEKAFRFSFSLAYAALYIQSSSRRLSKAARQIGKETWQ